MVLKKKVKGKTSFEHKTEMVTIYHIQQCFADCYIKYLTFQKQPIQILFADAVESSVGGSGARKVKNGKAGLAHRQSRTSWGHQVMGLQPCSSLPTFLMGLHAMLMSGACVGWN